MFIETKDMLRPKIYVINKRKVYDVDYINFDDKSYGVTEEDGLCEEYIFNEVALMENTGLKDKYGDYVYVGSILTDEGVLEDDYWDYATIEKDIDDGYCISWINNEFSESLYECSSYSVVGNIYENKELLKC